MMEEPELQQQPPVLSPCSSGRRRRSSASNSPEFEFWMVRNPSFPQPNILSADELFSDGVLLPLHLLHHHHSNDNDPPDLNPLPAQENSSQPEPSGSGFTGNEPGSAPDLSSVLAGFSAPTFTASKRWKNIFRKGESSASSSKDKDKLKKKDKRSGGGGNSNGAELNINIWPFSRSRSAGIGGSRPRMATVGSTRKVSSAPCSRSNSAGESKSRKWPSSPSRGGVHLGRNSPVWQVRRGGGGGVSVYSEKGVKKESHESRRKSTGRALYGTGGPKAKVLSLNVPMCIGYKNHLSCRSDENSAIGIRATAVAAGGGVTSVEAVRGNNNLFNFRGLFTKKVH